MAMLVNKLGSWANIAVSSVSTAEMLASTLAKLVNIGEMSASTQVKWDCILVSWGNILEMLVNKLDSSGNIQVTSDYNSVTLDYSLAMWGYSLGRSDCI